MKKNKIHEIYNNNEPDYKNNLFFEPINNKSVNTSNKKSFVDNFIKIFDHIIWYIIAIIIIICITLTDNNSKQIYLTGTLKCQDINK